MTAQQAAAQISDVMAKDVPTVTYNWPADPEALGNTPGEQLGEVLEQIDWIEEALIDYSVEAPRLEDLVADLYHRVEMFWRCLALRNGQGYVDRVFQRHEDGLKDSAA